MYCKYCGNKLDDNALFCSNCGKKIEGRETEEKPVSEEVKTNDSVTEHKAEDETLSVQNQEEELPEKKYEEEPYEDFAYEGPAEQEKKKKWLIPVIIGAVILLLVIGIALIGGGDKAEEPAAEEPVAEEDDSNYMEAYMEYVSADVSDYPTVRLYYRIVDPMDSETISDLQPKMFTISECVQGGAYVERKIKEAQKLDNSEGLSITLAVDKSGSIGTDDMDKIKTVMNEFVGSLQYEVGDQTEILSFDTIVRQMCTYTSDVTLLRNGISNMYPEGQTAFYDAVMTGIIHAANQKGAGCVVAFTDGYDNQSIHTYDQVVSRAVEYGVPVYIIGVGYDVEESELRYIAETSGGKYWHIDNLYDLSEIYTSVYEKEKDLYVIEYESDSSIDKYATRTVEVTFKGEGYKGSCIGEFTPNTVTDPTAYKHSGKYEIFAEDVSWEEASARCIEKGGHLATITSQGEMDTIVKLAEAKGYKYLWLGGYTSYDYYGNVFGHWITGETFDYQAWGAGEPSRVDLDGTEEYYIMLWYIPSLGGWNWNDQRNSTVDAGFHQGKIAYVCEWE